MRITVDIPDTLYRRLKSAAAARRCSIKDIVLRGVKAEVGRYRRQTRRKPIQLPIIDSARPGWLKLSNRQIDKILFP